MKWRNIIAAGVLFILLLSVEGKLADVLCASADMWRDTVRKGDFVHISGYESTDNRYTPVNDDPYISIKTDRKRRMNKISVNLSEGLTHQTEVQVFYDAGRGYNEEDSVVISAPAGERKLDIMIPGGNYSYLRLDINGAFVLDRIELEKVGSQNNAFKNTLFWGCALFLNVLLLFLINQLLHLFQVVSFRERDWKNRKCSFSLWAVLFLAGLLVINSLYLGDGSFYYQSNDNGNGLLSNIQHYFVNNKLVQYQGNADSSVETECPDDVRSMVFYFGSAPEKNIPVKVRQIGREGRESGEESTVLWKKGTNSMAVTGLKQSCAGVKLSIPASFELTGIYYRIARENAAAGKGILVGIWLILSFGMGVMLSCSVRVLRMTEEIWEKGQKVIQNRKSIWKRAGKYVVCIPVSMAAVSMIIVACGSVFDWHATGKIIAFACGVVLLIDMAALFYRYFVQKIELMGFFCILIVGSLFAFLAPPCLGVSWDDETHYQNAVRLSHSLDRRISCSDQMLWRDYTANALNKQYYSEKSQISYNALLDQLEDLEFYAEDTGAVFRVSQLVYLPSAFGLVAARGIGLPFHIALIAGRWCNVWLLAFLAYFAMRRLRSGKLVVLLVALIPTNIFIAGNYTYDTWLVGWTLLGFSAFFGEWQRPEAKVGRSAKWLIVCSLFIAVLAKETYIIMTLAALFLPNKKFSGKKEAWCYRGMIIGAVLLPLALLYFVKMGGGNVAMISDSRGGTGVSSTGQIDFICRNPVKAAGVLIHYLTWYLNPIKEGIEYLNNMAYFGYISIPFGIILATVIFGAVFSREESEPAKFPWWFRGGFLLEYAGVGAMSAVAMYIAYTPVGAGNVMGCQGRYLLPVIFPVLYVLTRFSGKTYVKNVIRERNLNLIFLALMIFYSLQGLWTGCLTLY